MNLFILSTDPAECARFHCDRHIVKMPLETTQMLCVAFYHFFGITHRSELKPYAGLIEAIFENFPRKNPSGRSWPYGISHLYHPCSIWVRETDQNFRWALALGLELCKEYSRRYHKTHACEAILLWIAGQPTPALPGSLTPFAQTLPDVCKHPDPVVAYRSYYRLFKAHFAIWNFTPPPPWWRSVP